jgi:hypothetical protein
MRVSLSDTPKFWEAGVKLGMIAAVVGHTWLGQASTRLDVAIDSSLRVFMPANVECGKLGKEIKAAIR